MTSHKIRTKTRTKAHIDLGAYHGILKNELELSVSQTLEQFYSVVESGLLPLIAKNKNFDKVEHFAGGMKPSVGERLTWKLYNSKQSFEY